MKRNAIRKVRLGEC